MQFPEHQVETSLFCVSVCTSCFLGGAGDLWLTPGSAFSVSLGLRWSEPGLRVSSALQGGPSDCLAGPLIRLLSIARHQPSTALPDVGITICQIAVYYGHCYFQ